jgi:hypothetical protein
MILVILFYILFPLISFSFNLFISHLHHHIVFLKNNCIFRLFFRNKVNWDYSVFYASSYLILYFVYVTYPCITFLVVLYLTCQNLSLF